MKAKTLIKQLAKYYHFEILIAVLCTYIAYVLMDDALKQEFMAMVLRKLGLFGMAMTTAYITRFIKIGIIEWNGVWRYVYAIIIVIVACLIFALG